MTQPPKWIEEFEAIDEYQTMDLDEPMMIGKEAARKFITETLAAHHTLLKERIEKEKKPIEGSLRDRLNALEYNDGLDAALTIIEEIWRQKFAVK